MEGHVASSSAGRAGISATACPGGGPPGSLPCGRELTLTSQTSTGAARVRRLRRACQAPWPTGTNYGVGRGFAARRAAVGAINGPVARHLRPVLPNRPGAKNRDGLRTTSAVVARSRAVHPVTHHHHWPPAHHRGGRPSRQPAMTCAGDPTSPTAAAGRFTAWDRSFGSTACGPLR